MREGGRRAIEVISFLKPLEITQVASYEALPEIVRNSSPYTLLAKDFFLEMLASAQDMRSRVANEEAWVQVGVWKGGGALFFRALMEDWGISSPLHLYDTFDGCRAKSLSHPEDRRFVEALNLGDVTEPYESEVVSLLKKFGLNSGVHLHKGDVNHLDKGDVPEKIAFLHLDVDFYEPTFSAMNLFFDRVVEGGVILVDDYYLDLVNCRQAIDKFIDGMGIRGSITIEKFSSFSAVIKKLPAL